MTDATHRSDPPDVVGDEPGVPAGVETTERYAVEGGVVFYDAANPLAWLEADDTVWLAEQV